MTDKAAYMLVTAKVKDGQKMGNYQKALMESGLYPKNEGFYLTKGRPIEIFEGEWPDNQAVVIAKFPSADHARNFWHSDEYQNQVKPLRDGAAEISVALFEESDS